MAATNSCTATCPRNSPATPLTRWYTSTTTAWNGATRIVTGSHRPALGEPSFDFNDESRFVQLTGNADDILIFDADLIHAGSLNPSGSAGGV